MEYHYSPATGELIITDTPADWMDSTSIPPPAFAPATQGCFFRAGAWEIVDALSSATSSAESPVLACTPWQIRKALNQLGLRAEVEQAVALAGQEAMDGWAFAQEFRRDDQLIAQLAAALGKTSAEVDAVFSLAGSL